MITAVDTNVLLDLLGSPSTKAADQAEAALFVCAEAGTLVISPICYAELAPRFLSGRALDGFLDRLGIERGELSRESCFLAGKLFADYVRRGGKRNRILPDFFVAAHAMTSADRLLTRDGRFYKADFDRLQAMTPAEVISARLRTVPCEERGQGAASGTLPLRPLVLVVSFLRKNS